MQQNGSISSNVSLEITKNEVERTKDNFDLSEEINEESKETYQGNRNIKLEDGLSHNIRRNLHNNRQTRHENTNKLLNEDI